MHGGIVFYLVNNFVVAVKKRSKIIIIFALGCLACMFILISVPVISQIQLPNPIKLGVRTLAYPIGNNVHSNGSGGFCGTFGEQLKQKLAWWIAVKYVDIENEHLDPNYPRYNGLRTAEDKNSLIKDKNDYKIHIECGPNSISSQKLTIAKNIEFSNTFYDTGVRLLLKQGLAHNLNNIKIGVVKGTTTFNLLEGRYDIVGYNSGDKALDALDKNQVQAFASDALIVWTLLEKGVNEPKRTPRHAYKNSGYHIFPNGSYLSNTSKQQYALAVNGETKFSKQLLGLINNSLSRDFISQAQAYLKNCEDAVCIPLQKANNERDWKSYLIVLAIVFPVLIWFIKLYRANTHVTNFRDFLLVFLQVAIGILTPNQQIIYVCVFSILLSFVGLLSLLNQPKP